MSCVQVYLIFTLLVAVSVTQILPFPEVTIEQGTLRGKFDTSANGRQFAAFRGIPYAQAPIGKQRFKEPKAPKPWVGVLNAVDTRPECLQYNHFSYNVQGDEDCLYVNVFTPSVPVNAQSSRQYDVIVYIHGGAFMFQMEIMSTNNSFGPHYLLDRDVVFVTFSYRLGPLGFLSTGDTVIPGNNGLKDQSAALRWVQKNIAAFGGNPASVTIIGLSAGGASVHYHYLSPLSQGLFARGISFSGTALCSWTMMDNAREKAFQLGTNLGCNTQDSILLLNCLRNRPASQIVQQSKNFMGWLYNPYSPFGPTVEAVDSKTPFITQEPYQLLKSGLFQQLPWITAVTSEEGLYPGAELYSPSERFEELNSKWNELLPHLLDFNLTVEAELKEDVCNDIKSFYLNKQTASENPSQVIQMIGDRLFVSCGEEAAKIQAETSSAPVYFYYFTYKGSKSLSNLFTHDDRNVGVSHGDDTLYFINYPAFNLEVPVPAQDKEMSQRLLDFVTSYARDGIPRFTPNFVFPTVKEGLPALQYIHIKSPSEFVKEQSTDLGHSEFWFNLPFHEMVNIAKQEALLGEATTAKDEL